MPVVPWCGGVRFIAFEQAEDNPTLALELKPYQ